MVTCSRPGYRGSISEVASLLLVVLARAARCKPAWRLNPTVGPPIVQRGEETECRFVAIEQVSRRRNEVKRSSLSIWMLASWLILVSCSTIQVATDTPEPAPTPTSTPTPTPLAPGLGPGGSLPTSGEIESRFTFPLTGEECVSHFPFTIKEEQGRLVIEGEGVIDCSSSGELCGDICLTHNHIIYADVTLNGEVLMDSPGGVLHVDLACTITNTQYFTDYPPDALVLFTEETPFQVEGSDTIPLTFAFEDGATTEVEVELALATEAGAEAPPPWTLILHLN